MPEFTLLTAFFWAMLLLFCCNVVFFHCDISLYLKSLRDSVSRQHYSRRYACTAYVLAIICITCVTRYTKSHKSVMLISEKISTDHYALIASIITLVYGCL